MSREDKKNEKLWWMGMYVFHYEPIGGWNEKRKTKENNQVWWSKLQDDILNKL